MAVSAEKCSQWAYEVSAMTNDIHSLMAQIISTCGTKQELGAIKWGHFWAMIIYQFCPSLCLKAFSCEPNCWKFHIPVAIYCIPDIPQVSCGLFMMWGQGKEILNAHRNFSTIITLKYQHFRRITHMLIYVAI